MQGHAVSRHSMSHAEGISLLDEKSWSDIESETGHVDLDSKTPPERWIDTASSYTVRIGVALWRTVVLRPCLFVLPSFAQSRFSREYRVRTDKLSPTSYLDGMRGLAALFVFFCHLSYTSFLVAEGWGHGENNDNWLKLPFIRLFYQGAPMVSIFFVISGYSLSLKPLRLARAGTFDALAATLSSFVFRRAFRLFLPPAISTLIVVFLLRQGIFEWTRGFAWDPAFLHNHMEWHPELRETLTEQLWDWTANMLNFIHVWSWEKFGGSTGYDVHLWTIPVEFRCSMVLFLVLLGTARLRTLFRYISLALLFWFTYRSNKWELILFFGGMGLAEFDLITKVHSDPSCSAVVTPATLPSTLDPAHCFLGLIPPKRRHFTVSILWVLLGILALFLMSAPDDYGEDTPGWVYLWTWTPEAISEKERYWQGLGSLLFVLAVSRTPGWQRLFDTSVVQYLGRISYALYLVHGPVLHTAGYMIERWFWGITGTEGTAYNWGFALAAIFILPLTVWVADVFWRAVDAPSVRFARWVEAACSVSI